MKKELLLGWFDAYVERVRSLARHLLRTDHIEDRPELLATNWRKVRWYDAMWLFELEGIRACGYPAVFDNAAVPEYATPEQFVWFAGCPVTPADIEHDPRFVAYRSMHDFIVLHAKVLAERGECPDWTDDLPDDPDPLQMIVPRDEKDGDTRGVIGGNPLRRLHCGFPHTGDDNYVVPDWQDVQDPFGALRYFHLRGLLLPEELRYGALRDKYDPRLTQLELLTPDVFAAYIRSVLWKRLNNGSLQRWGTRPSEEVARDPRFIAHRCGFDRQMILHISTAVTRTLPEPEDDGPELVFESTLSDEEYEALKVAFWEQMGITGPPPEGGEEPR